MTPILSMVDAMITGDASPAELTAAAAMKLSLRKLVIQAIALSSCRPLALGVAMVCTCDERPSLKTWVNAERRPRSLYLTYPLSYRHLDEIM